MAKQTIRKGYVIVPNYITPRVLVKRNDIVPVEVVSGNLTVSMRAKALADAAIGDVIDCQNLTSKQTFSAVLRKDGVLEVL
jgi:flagella basal body P-ring formation protein FlgA